jgi:hypothetical protein
MEAKKPSERCMTATLQGQRADWSRFPQMDGIKGLLFVAEKIGALLMVKPDTHSTALRQWKDQGAQGGAGTEAICVAWLIL